MDVASEIADRIDLDDRTLALGREIFALARAAPATESWWDRKVMAMGMSDEAVKAQLFRLVDVLPVLTTPEAVNRHLREYLTEVKDRLPLSARAALAIIPRNGVLGRVLANTTLKNTRRMARRFIAASDAQEAITAARALRGRRMTFTLDLLGEAVLAASEAVAYQKYYLNLIETLAVESQTWSEDPLIDRDHLGPIPKVNVSVNSRRSSASSTRSTRPARAGPSASDSARSCAWRKTAASSSTSTWSSSRTRTSRSAFSRKCSKSRSSATGATSASRFRRT
jgi:hypothetical protein